MKAKYVEERFPDYFIFGEHPQTGMVDVSDGDKDVLQNVSIANAESIIRDRHKIVNFLCSLVDAFDKAAPEEFKKFWYDDESR